MEVVGQETIMVELEGEAMAIAVQEAQKVPAVLGVGEYGLPVVTAVHNVVASGRAMLILARCAGHRSAPHWLHPMLYVNFGARASRVAT